MSRPMVISLIGRPNVGKSTLFNRLLGKMQKAIISDRPGATRDRHYALAQLSDEVSALLVDTGGFYPQGSSSERPLYEIMAHQVKLAVAESDLTLFVVDVREGLLPADHDICQYLRSSGRPFGIVVNKVDSNAQESGVGEFYQLGIASERCFPISAAHGLGAGELVNFLLQENQQFQKAKEIGELQSGVLPERDIVATLCLIGPPNVGKSTLLNQLLKAPRALVSEVAGTTVDPVEGHFDLSLGQGEKGAIKVLDTAGIRKKSQVKEDLEQLSVYRALRAIGEASIAICVVDATLPMTHQERRLVDIALDKGVSVIVALNKIDLLPAQTARQRREWMLDLRAKIAWLNFCALVPLSARQGLHLDQLKKVLQQTVKARTRSIPTSKLNQVVGQLVEKNPLYPKGAHRQMLKVKYASQVKNSPPTILLFANRSRHIPPPYRRYLQRGIREAFGLKNTPIHLVFRSGRA